jgi:ActR/RegA family two-component response regulator
MPETAGQTHDRLCKVIADSDFAALSEPHAWQKVEHLSTLPSASLAVVRDDSAWYALAPVADGTVGTYRILAFHFVEGSNASGFVAWLAALVKKEAATGAMVVCGYDARATDALWQTSLGLFDYWGCPWDRGDDVVALVERLRGKRQQREPSSS